MMTLWGALMAELQMAPAAPTGASVQLRAVRNRYEHIRSGIREMTDQAVAEGRDITDDEFTQIRSMTDDARQLWQEYAGLLEEHQRQQQVNKLTAAITQTRSESLGSGGVEPVVESAAPYSLVPDRAQLEQLRQAVAQAQAVRLTHGRQDGLQLRATVTASDVGGQVWPSSGQVPHPRRIVAELGLPPTKVTSRGMSGPLFGPTSGQDPTAEGQVKPEADDVSEATIAIHALARWTDITRQALLAHEEMAEQIAAWHAQAIAKDEDRLIVQALDAAAGAPISVGAPADRVRTAIARVADDVSADADLVVCHPDDYALLASFAPSSGTDVSSWADRIGSALIYPTSQGTTVGRVLVGAVRAAGRWLVAESPATVSMEDLKTNEITIRTEELVGFGLRMVGAVQAVSLDNGS